MGLGGSLKGRLVDLQLQIAKVWAPHTPERLDLQGEVREVSLAFT